MLVDTHCHLHFEAFDADRGAVIERARAAGVSRMVLVGTDPQTNEQAQALAAKHAFMRATAGLHPHSAHEVPENEIKELEAFVKKNKPAAIGEIGLDYFKSEAEASVQKTVFRRMIGIAKDNGLPVIVHSRNAFDDTLQILKEEGGGKLKGVMHCFSYGSEELKKLFEIGFLASFTANITFKNATGLLDACCEAPLERIMLETDSPYLAPQAFRGQRNEPAHLVEVAKIIAQKRGLSEAQVSEVTTRTAVDFFKLPPA